ncbi:class D sortase [Paenibacillus sp. PK3_47]|uniref:class D sortase n=1 Tax=Paenibacillus sp. PK3_47 TaxID=2072642 RepID=UPI00201E09B3|nr:class D sortase [Paenibacillus sp. PK3_47]UQZ34006.1 class D sortase [Paenibacillus sp. PK3_47]
MNKRSGLVIAMRLILILSSILLVYSAVQILKAPAEAGHALKAWEKKREEALISPAHAELNLTNEETPLTAEMINLAVERRTSSRPQRDGDVIGEIYFPRLGTRAAILEGTQRPQLKKGAGHYEGSAVIGAAGNSVLAGHRDTVFRGLGRLKKQDLIEVETADGRFIYEVTGSVIVDGEERGAIQDSDDAVLTLITCYPFSYVGSAPDRYLLSAALLRHEPLTK